MYLSNTVVVAALLTSGKLAFADSYANNQIPTIVDSAQVAANFPAIEDVTLLSPAFVNLEGVPIGFENGTSGPTSQVTLGEKTMRAV